MICEKCKFEIPEQWKHQHFHFCPDCGADQTPETVTVKSSWRAMAFIGEFLAILYWLALICYMFAWESVADTVSKNVASKELSFAYLFVAPLVGLWGVRGIAVLMQRPLRRFSYKVKEMRLLTTLSMDEYLDHREGSLALIIAGWLLSTGLLWFFSAYVCFGEFAFVESESLRRLVASKQQFWAFAGGFALAGVVLVLGRHASRRIRESFCSYPVLGELLIIPNKTTGAISPACFLVSKQDYVPPDERPSEDPAAATGNASPYEEPVYEEPGPAYEEPVYEEPEPAYDEPSQGDYARSYEESHEQAPQPLPPASPAGGSSIRVYQGAMQAEEDEPARKSSRSKGARTGKLKGTRITKRKRRRP